MTHGLRNEELTSRLRFSELLQRFFQSIRIFCLFPGFEFYNYGLLFLDDGILEGYEE